jgi:hypothetical protein
MRRRNTIRRNPKSKLIDRWLKSFDVTSATGGMRARRSKKKYSIWYGMRKSLVSNRFYNTESIKMNVLKDDIFLGANDIADMLTSKFLQKRFVDGLETYQTRVSLYATKKEWEEYENNFEELRRFKFENTVGYFFNDVNSSYIYYNIHSTHVSVEMIGDKDFVETYKTQLARDFDFVKNQIEWIYSADGSSIEIPLRHDRMPVEEMYPFLNGQTLAEFYDGFMHSSASILLLIGPPGTGKTTFIRGLLQHSEASAIVSYDSNVLEKDYVFANFIEGEKNVLVLEDADMFLKARSEGNTMMHKFLNVGDGLVTTRNKKLIFSTNLPSIRDIDSALIRPGRCYDILHFDELNQEQAEQLATKVGTKLNRERESWSIADVFFEQNTNTKKNIERKMGFI